MSNNLREMLEPLIAASEAHGARIDFQLARFQTMLAEQAGALPLHHVSAASDPAQTEESVRELKEAIWDEAYTYAMLAATGGVPSAAIPNPYRDLSALRSSGEGGK